MICATGRQEAAALTAVSEAVVNLSSSIYLASRFGAMGVAYGTLIGSFVSVSLHFATTMHFTRQTLAISRSRLFLTGLLQPAISAIPSLLLLPFWWSPARLTLGPGLTVVWVFCTLAFAWFGGLNKTERDGLMGRRLSRFIPSY
jgi:peptidoglycan biosynthesis protein MviN/MurJ (putative lipid II flippase)